LKKKKEKNAQKGNGFSQKRPWGKRDAEEKSMESRSCLHIKARREAEDQGKSAV